jgi:hypothetical protein
VSASVLLDTSFLISLVQSDRPNHLTAKQYYRHLLEKNIPMYLSAIVASEFGIKQPISDLPLGNFRSLHFNIVHGQKAAEVWNALGVRDAGDTRAAVRDDAKLIAQASHEGIHFILTEDASSLHKYCERLREAGHISTRSVTLREGFRPEFLRDDGQVDWIGDVSGKAEPRTPTDTDDDGT